MTLRHIQTLNTLMMGVFFVLAFLSIPFGWTVLFATVCVLLFFTFLLERKLEEWRKHPKRINADL